MNFKPEYLKASIESIINDLKKGYTIASFERTERLSGHICQCTITYNILRDEKRNRIGYVSNETYSEIVERLKNDPVYYVKIEEMNGKI